MCGSGGGKTSSKQLKHTQKYDKAVAKDSTAQTERMVAAPVATYQEDEQKDAKLDDSVTSAIQRISHLCQ